MCKAQHPTPKGKHPTSNGLAQMWKGLGMGVQGLAHDCQGALNEDDWMLGVGCGMFDVQSRAVPGFLSTT
jgi:hypothetical protein